ncbi:CRISPR-associated endonuclease Cas1 [Stenoxybacter acetivorans]|uniref:CRISPR-associated endonuclease Cas1 n=1 Tax=Stenoxybacter acetivorans TaxID=422441 RepID=UPI00068F8161|nr:CRISPR-associated endonuclease Cas1 [Stenoxybacter acetivorans]
MSSLYLDKKGLTLRTQKDTLLIYEADRRVANIPLRLLERLMIIGQIQLTASVLGKLGSLGIGVVVLSGLKHEISLLLPAKADAARRLNQYRHCTQNALPLAQQLLADKFSTQQAHLHHYQTTDHSLWQHWHTQINQAKSLETLLGLEGQAAKYYWRQLASLLPAEWLFQGRKKHPAPDPVNALLSLSYTLLYAESVRLLTAAGLDSSLGFYHQPQANRASLACDVMEPVRADIDRWVWQHLLQGTWQASDFEYQYGACLLHKAQRQAYYPLFEADAAGWRAHLKQEIHTCLNRFNIECANTENDTQWQTWAQICRKTSNN